MNIKLELDLKLYQQFNHLQVNKQIPHTNKNTQLLCKHSFYSFEQ